MYGVQCIHCSKNSKNAPVNQKLRLNLTLYSNNVDIFINVNANNSQHSSVFCGQKNYKKMRYAQLVMGPAGSGKVSIN